MQNSAKIDAGRVKSEALLTRPRTAANSRRAPAQRKLGALQLFQRKVLPTKPLLQYRDSRVGGCARQIEYTLISQIRPLLYVQLQSRWELRSKIIIMAAIIVSEASALSSESTR